MTIHASFLIWNYAGNDFNEQMWWKFGIKQLVSRFRRRKKIKILKNKVSFHHDASEWGLKYFQKNIDQASKNWKKTSLYNFVLNCVFVALNNFQYFRIQDFVISRVLSKKKPRLFFINTFNVNKVHSYFFNRGCYRYRVSQAILGIGDRYRLSDTLSLTYRVSASVSPIRSKVSVG